MNKLFIFQPGKNRDYEHELLAAFNKCGKRPLKACLSKVHLDALISDSVQVVVSSGLPKEWYFILKGLNIVTITIGEIGRYFDLADIVIDYKSLNNECYFTGPSYSVCKNPELHFEAIANLITKLEWDSKFWGFSVARVNSKHLTENSVRKINEVIKRDKFRFVEYLCDCHDDRGIKTAEKCGFHLTDMRMTFEKRLSAELDCDVPGKFTFSKAKEKDIVRLKHICRDLYQDSRYFFDNNFEKKKVKEFYASWIEKAVLGKYDDECFCLNDNGLAIGFCTIKYNFPAKSAKIGLFGIAHKYQGKGLGKALLNSVFCSLADKKINKIQVVTQVRNYAAQRAYQSVGFLTKEAQLWYHKWF